MKTNGHVLEMPGYFKKGEVIKNFEMYMRRKTSTSPFDLEVGKSMQCRGYRRSFLTKLGQKVK